MGKYVFSREERYSVFTTHGEKCYLGKEPLVFSTMEVDHVIPESLLQSPSLLADTLHTLGLPPSFNLNSFLNWLPICRSCNLTKLQVIFEPTPLIQLLLQKLRLKAKDAERSCAELVSNQAISKALAVLELAHSGGRLTPPMEAEIQALAAPLIKPRLPELQAAPLRMAPFLEIISESNGVRLVRGPYGVGASPINPTGNFKCGTCGHSGWNGARCVFCGNCDDD